MATTFEEQTRKIAKEYCRNIVVIDDKIFYDSDDKPKQPYNDAYQAFYESCNEEGIACHFYHYRDSDDALENAKKLASRADVLILDWYLSPILKQETAIAIIEDIIRNETVGQSIRFILIYTDQTIPKVCDDIQKTFSDLISISENNISLEKKPHTTDKQEDEKPTIITGPSGDLKQINGNDPIYLGNGKLFIGIHHKKPDDPVLDGKKLIIIIYDLLSSTYSDYLHWAGLELSVRIRDLMPQLLASLPEGTNGPILYQSIFQDGESEISDQIVEVILDELKMQFSMNPIQALQRGFFDEFIKEKLLDTKIITQDILLDKPNLRKKLIKISDNIKNGKKLEDIQQINSQINGFMDIENHRSWAMLRESLIFNVKNSNNTIRTGFIYRGTNFTIKIEKIIEGKKDNIEVSYDYLLCLSPACDCYRPENKKLIFIRGTENTQIGPAPTITQYESNEKSIQWDTRFIESLSIDELNDCKLFGALRKDFVNRIIQRVWNHQTRVGVDSSELLRRIRKE
ncbi:MAG: response regulator receiver domain [Leptospirales bacterium]